MSNTILTGEAAADILAAMQKAGLNGWEMFVPEGVEEIAPGAFAGMKNLRRVQLPKTLRRIGAAAFYGCGNLAQIALPAGLVELGTAAFKNSGLQEISIPPRVARLGGEAFADSALRCAEIKGRQTGASMFRGCCQLAKVQLSGNIRKIEAGMFRGCAFETVHIPETVEELHWEMFSECRHLKNVYIPAGVKYIEADVFYGCDALKNVCFGADLTAMQAIRIGEGNEALSKAVLRCGILNKPETGEK